MIQSIYLTKQDKKQTIYHSKITSAMFITDYLITGTEDGFVTIHYLLGMQVIYNKQVNEKAILDICKVPQKPYIVMRTSENLLFFDDRMNQKQEIVIKAQWISPAANFFSGLEPQLEKQVLIPQEHQFVLALQTETGIQVVEYIEKKEAKEESADQDNYKPFKVIYLFKNQWKQCVFTPLLNLFIAIDKRENLSAYNINGKYFGTYNKQIKIAKLIHFQYNQFWFITVDNRVQVVNIELSSAENHVQFYEYSVATKIVQTSDNSQSQRLYEVPVYINYQPVALQQEYTFDQLKLSQQSYDYNMMYLVSVDNKCASYEQQITQIQYNKLITISQINLLQQNYVDCNDWEKMNASLDQFIKEIYNEEKTTGELASDLQTRLQSDIDLYRSYGYNNDMFDQQMKNYQQLSQQVQDTLHNVCNSIIPTQSINGSIDINQNSLDFNQHNFKAYCKNFNFIDFVTERQKVINYCKDILQKESKQQNDAILSYAGENQLLNIEQMSYMIYKGKPDWNNFSAEDDIEWSQYDNLEELSEDDPVADIDVSKYMPLTEQPQPMAPLYIDQLDQYDKPDLSIFDNIQLNEISQGPQFEKYEEKIDYDLPEVDDKEVSSFVGDIVQQCVKDHKTHAQIVYFVDEIIQKAEKQAEVSQGVKDFIKLVYEKSQQLAVVKQNEWQQQSKIFVNQSIQQAQNYVLEQRKAERIRKEQERIRLLEEERKRKLEEERQLRIKLEQERIAKLQQQFQEKCDQYNQKLTINHQHIEQISFNYKQVKQYYKQQCKKVQQIIVDQIEAQKLKEEQERQKQIQLEREKARKEAEQRKKLLKQKQLEEQERKRLEQEQLKAQKEKERQERKQLLEQKAKVLEQKRKEAEQARKQNKNAKKRYEESESYSSYDYEASDYSSYSSYSSYDNSYNSYSSEEEVKPKNKKLQKKNDSYSTESSEIVQKKQKKPIQKKQETSEESQYSYSYSEYSEEKPKKQVKQQKKQQIKEQSSDTESSSLPVQKKTKPQQRKFESSTESEKVVQKQSQKIADKKKLQLSESSSSEQIKQSEPSFDSDSESERHKVKESINQSTNVKSVIKPKSKYEESSEEKPKEKQQVIVAQKPVQKQQKTTLQLSSSSNTSEEQTNDKQDTSESEVHASKTTKKQVYQKKQQEETSSSEPVKKQEKKVIESSSSEEKPLKSSTGKLGLSKKRFQSSDDEDQKESQDSSEPITTKTTIKQTNKLLVDSSEEESNVKKEESSSSTYSERKQIKDNKSLLIKSKAKYVEDSDTDKPKKFNISESSSSKQEESDKSSSEQSKKQQKPRRQRRKVETSSDSEEEEQNQSLAGSIKNLQQKAVDSTQQITQQIKNSQETIVKTAKNIQDKIKEVFNKTFQSNKQQTNEIQPSKKHNAEIIEEMMEEESEQSQQVVTATNILQKTEKIDFKKESTESSQQIEDESGETKPQETQQMLTNDILERHQQMQVTSNIELLHKITCMSASNQLVYASLCRQLQLQAFDIITNDMLKLISYYWPPSARIGKQFVLLPTQSEKSAWDTLLPAYDMINHKRLSCKQLPPNLSQLQFIRTYRALRHEGILKYQGCGWSQYNQLYIFTDEIPSISLLDCLQNQQLFNEIFPTVESIRIFIKKLVEIIVFLNGPQNRLMHRDLRPSTIYINKKHQPCLYHIGFMQGLNCNEPEEINTIFAAPEVVCGSCFLTSDTWSIGTLTVTLLLHKLCDWSQLSQYKLFTNDLITLKKDCPAGWTINEINNAKIILQMAQVSKDATKIKNSENYQIVKENYFETFAKQNKVKQIKSYKSCVGHVFSETVQEEGFQLSNLYQILQNCNVDESIITFIKQCYVFDGTKRVRCNSLLEQKWLQQSEQKQANVESSDEDQFIDKLQQNEKNKKEEEVKEGKKQKKVVKKVIRRLVKKQ